jgi:hypothetical protein
MELITLLRSVKNGVFICHEGEPEFPRVLALFYGEADSAFNNPLSVIAIDRPGDMGRCASIEFRFGLSLVGERLLASLEQND